MPEPTDNLVLEHLRYIRGRLDELFRIAEEHTGRFSRIDEQILAVRRDLLMGAADTVAIQAQVDRLTRDVERIQRRLDLTDTPGEK